MQKLLIMFHLFIFVFISIIVGDRLEDLAVMYARVFSLC